MMDLDEYTESLDDRTKVYQVFQVLKDQKWHCRRHEYTHINIGQLAGSGGIQGLERGSTKRVGIVLKSENKQCNKCKKNIMHDRWTGDFSGLAAPTNMSREFQQRVINLLGSKDVVDGGNRSANELTIDHKLPMIRWSENTQGYQTNYDVMGDDDIKHAFQLLKKSNGSVSHNLLKSRACETCLKTKKRGTPFGIKFFWHGDEKWRTDKHDPAGCKGCGWYDFEKWRTELNKFIRNNS